MAEGILEVEDNSFESEVMGSDMPVVVDFWAPWCGPCRAIGPIVEELAEKYKDRVKFVKCNVDENPSTPVTYEVRAIPTLLFVKGGSVVSTITGMTARAKLEETIETML